MKKDYMSRLERWARWMLPRQEAEDVIADYREIVADEELRQGLGKPRSVIKPLVQPKQYRTWLAVFAVMAACILIPAWSPLPLGPYPVWFTLFTPEGFLIPGVPLFLWFMILGFALSLIWFRPQKGEAKTPLPRSLPIALAVLLVVMGLAWWVLWQISLYPEGALVNPILHLPYGFWWPLGSTFVGGNLIAFLLEWGGAAVGIAGFMALVRARTCDRRWRAAYFLSLSVMMLVFCVLSLLTSMDVSSSPNDWMWHDLPLYLEITIIGLIGTGVSLC